MTWTISLARKFSTLFYHEERIVREIYDFHYNRKDKALKANFSAFREIKATGKKEMSCVRFELESLENCRLLGQSHANKAKSNLVGYACTKVSYINLWSEYSLRFTPKMNEEPPNPFHVDIYDNSNGETIEGEANTSYSNLQREIFKEVWKIYLDTDTIQHQHIQPFQNLRDYIINQNN